MSDDEQFHARVTMHVSAAIIVASKALNLEATNTADAFVQDVAGQFANVAPADTAAYFRAIAELVENTHDDAASDAIYERLDAILSRIDQAALARAAAFAAKKPAAGAN